MNTKEAKRLSKIEKELLKKFLAAEKEEVEEPKAEKPQEEYLFTKEAVARPLNVSSAKSIEKLKDKLESEFQTQHRREKREVEELEKRYQPITRAIKENTTVEEKVKDIVPYRNFVTSTPRAIRFADEDLTEEDESLDSPTTPEKQSYRQNKSIKQILDSSKINLGGISSIYLKRANDKKFGIYVDEEDDQFKIGSQPISFDFDDIIFTNSNKKYKGTQGLWRLLTKNDYFDQEGMYTDDDWEKYKEILLSTGSLFQSNNPNSKKPKSSSGRKYTGMIKKIWEEYKGKKIGHGLANYNENPVEYKYVSNLHELMQRLAFIQAQETAGNNNFHNEKLALAKFLADRMEELIQTPKGIKYLVRCFSILPESMIEGSGLFNDFLNSKWMPELHAPGYNFLGPFTRLDKRLERGDKGINPLDEAAKRHDLFYKDHKDTESRHVADKILQDEAWERVKSKDADLDERLVGLATTGGMWVKRKLGWGLNTSSYTH